jgi:hypothetical protein
VLELRTRVAYLLVHRPTVAILINYACTIGIRSRIIELLSTSQLAQAVYSTGFVCATSTVLSSIGSALPRDFMERVYIIPRIFVFVKG